MASIPMEHGLLLASVLFVLGMVGIGNRERMVTGQVNCSTGQACS